MVRKHLTYTVSPDSCLRSFAEVCRGAAPLYQGGCAVLLQKLGATVGSLQRLLACIPPFVSGLLADELHHVKSLKLFGRREGLLLLRCALSWVL